MPHTKSPALYGALLYYLKKIMKVLFISGPFCSRCHTLKPYLEKYCEDKGYEFVEKDVTGATPEELGEATMLPVVRFGEEQMDYDKVLETITK